MTEITICRTSTEVYYHNQWPAKTLEWCKAKLSLSACNVSVESAFPSEVCK